MKMLVHHTMSDGTIRLTVVKGPYLRSQRFMDGSMLVTVYASSVHKRGKSKAIESHVFGYVDWVRTKF